MALPLIFLCLLVWSGISCAQQDQCSTFTDRSEENIPGSQASPEPRVRAVDGPDGKKQLKCEVLGASPEPTVEWRDSDGNVLPAEKLPVEQRGGLYYVTLLANVTKVDLFTCVVTQKEICHQTSDDIFAVYVPVKVKEGDRALLPCIDSGTDITSQTIEWRKDGEINVFLYDRHKHDVERQDSQFRGRVSFFEDKLKNGIASVFINKTKVTDTGNYTCHLPGPNQRHTVELIVGACPKPSVRTIKRPDEKQLLECEVLGAFSKPTVEWRDSAGNVLPAEKPKIEQRRGLYYVTLSAALTKTDLFTCFVTQKDICHQTSDDMFAVYDSGTNWPAIFGVFFGGIFIGAIAVICFFKKEQIIEWCRTHLPCFKGPDNHGGTQPGAQEDVPLDKANSSGL